MIPTLEQIVSRVDDPETPVVWMDPALPESIWSSLPAGLAARGYSVFHIDADGPAEDREALLARFEDFIGLPDIYTHDFESLKNCLLAKAAEPSLGWAVLFSNPDPLRQNDEAAFEELMEVLALVHESTYEIHMKSFKLVVRD
jgi:RNAse (barnase) inhibitor barstar